MAHARQLQLCSFRSSTETQSVLLCEMLTSQKPRHQHIKTLLGRMQVVIITGCNTGLGKECARVLAARGAGGAQH